MAGDNCYIGSEYHDCRGWGPPIQFFSLSEPGKTIEPMRICKCLTEGYTHMGPCIKTETRTGDGIRAEENNVKFMGRGEFEEKKGEISKLSPDDLEDLVGVVLGELFRRKLQGISRRTFHGEEQRAQSLGAQMTISATANTDEHGRVQMNTVVADNMESWARAFVKTEVCAAPILPVCAKPGDVVKVDGKYWMAEVSNEAGTRWTEI